MAKRVDLCRWVVLFLAPAIPALAAGCGGPRDTDTGLLGAAAMDAAAGADAAPTDATPPSDANLSDAAADAGPPGALLVELCGTVATGLCAAMFACCDPCVTGGYGADEAECRDSVVAQCYSSLAGLQAAAGAGRLALDGAQLASCSSTLLAVASACDADVLFVVWEDCYQAIVGLVPAGGACAGDVLGFEWAECAGGTCAGGVCEPWLGPGADCSGGGACDVYELRCIAGAAATCQLPLPLGAPCTTDSDCESHRCGGACEPVTGPDVCDSF